MKIIQSLVLFVVLATLSGCSVRTDLFIQNITSEKIIIRIIYKIPIKLSEYESYIFQYKDGIVNPKSFLKNENLKPLKVNQSGQYSLTVEIPNNSTARIEKGYNSRYYRTIQDIEINNKKYSIEEFIVQTVGRNSDRVFKIELK